MPYPFLTNGRIFEEITYMNENQYISRISQLEKEISYLHGLLDEAGISYRKEAKIVEDLSPDKNILFDDNQGARIKVFMW